MNRSLPLTVSVALAACFALSGCTIYTYDSQTPAHHKPRKPTAAAKPASSGGLIHGTTGTTGTTATPGKNATPASDTPLVNNKIVFGGPAVQPFHGFAYVIPDGTARMP